MSSTHFASEGFLYTVHRIVVDHRDHDPLWLASRQHEEGGATRLVFLRWTRAASLAERRARAEEEVRLGQCLRHDNILRVLGGVVYEGEPSVVMEHMPGCFLLTLLGAAALAGRALSPECAAWIASEVAEALAHAHRCVDEEGTPLCLVHRAVSPIHIRVSHRARWRCVILAWRGPP